MIIIVRFMVVHRRVGLFLHDFQTPTGVEVFFKQARTSICFEISEVLLASV